MSEPTDHASTDDSRPDGSRSTLFTSERNPRPGGQRGRKRPPPLLRAMRRVLRQDKAKDATEGERHCRVMLEENRQKFAELMADMEKQHGNAQAKATASRNAAERRAGGKPKAAAAPAVRDEGTVRTLELIDRLLSEWERENPPDTCPTCAHQTRTHN